MDLAKDILDVAEKVGQAPGLTIASSIVTSILKTVETSKNNTIRLKTLAHSLASQLIDISENMEGKWDDAPLTLKRAIDEYDAFLLGMLKSITRLSQYSRARAFLLAGECEREIKRLEKRVADVRSTITLMIGMNLSVAMNQVQTSLASYGHIGREVHCGMRDLLDGARRLDSEPDSLEPTPDFSLFTREDFKVTKTISRQATYDLQRRDVMTVTIHQAERCSNGRAILVRTFEGSDLSRVRHEFTKELEISRKTLNPALLQIVGWSSAAAQLPFHVYHAPGGIIEPFFSWLDRTLLSNPVETIFGLYDMRHSIKELVEFGRSRHVIVSDMFFNGIVNIDHRGDRPRFTLIHIGLMYQKDLSFSESFRQDYDPYVFLSLPILFERSKRTYQYTSDMSPAATLTSMFAGGAKEWFGDPHGIEALFQGSYDTINPLQLGPVLLQAGWLGKSAMFLKPQGRVRLGDVGFLTQDGHFEVVTNLHTKLFSRTGGSPGWTYERFRVNKADPEDEYTVVTHAETLYRRYQHVVNPGERESSIYSGHQIRYTDLDEGCAWTTLHQEAFRLIEDNNLSIAPHEFQLLTSITDTNTFWIGRRHDCTGMVTPTGQEGFPSDHDTVTAYEFEREGSLSMLNSEVPELNVQIFYSFKDNIDELDLAQNSDIEKPPERGDLRKIVIIEHLQLPLGVTPPSSVKETIN